MSKTTSELKRNAVAALIMMAVLLAGTGLVMMGWQILGG